MPDLVVLSKCNDMGYGVLDYCDARRIPTCLWYMDPHGNFNAELIAKITRATYVCCSMPSMADCARAHNPHAFYVPEGFDAAVDAPVPEEDVCDNVSFIGQMRGHRYTYRQAYPFKIITGAFGREHARAVCRSRINLNFTHGGASDRVYKVLAAGGFLLTQPWPGMADDFTSEKDFVTFGEPADMRNKIEHYLAHPDEAAAIAAHGRQTVQKFSRQNWAQRILDCRPSQSED